MSDCRECCGTCCYNKKDWQTKEFCCGNEDSENYGLQTFYDDGCEDWEEK